jgi:hypothetical protein
VIEMSGNFVMTCLVQADPFGKENFATVTFEDARDRLFAQDLCLLPTSHATQDGGRDTTLHQRSMD